MTAQQAHLGIGTRLKEVPLTQIPCVLLLPVLVALITYCGCGGGATSPPPPPPAIKVSLSPNTANAPSGGTLQFSVTVANATDPSVTWEVNGTAGGNSSVGSISESGFYTAPAMLFDPMTVTVSAVSKADPTKSASAAVNILAAHRIGVREVNGIGEFFDRRTGNTFTPRGNNYIRLSMQQNAAGQMTFYHSTFNVSLYDATRS